MKNSPILLLASLLALGIVVAGIVSFATANGDTDNRDGGDSAAMYTCDESSEIQSTGTLVSELPGGGIQDITIDQNDDVFFITLVFDETIEVPMHSSSMPFSYCLSKLSDNEFEILDDRFIGGKILFDGDNNLWIMAGKSVYRQSNVTYKTPPDLTSGSFNSIDIDSKNNVWVCGLNTGLIKIDSELNVTKFNMTNSILPTNSMTSIHIDKFDNVWVALWDNQGILQIDGDNWTIYNSDNSNITSQNIWCVMTDKFDDVWIGTGHDDPFVSLMKFDGTDWIVQNPRDKYGNMIQGTVRTLVSDGEKLWIVSSISEDMAFSRCFLTTYDGSKWAEINEVSGEYVIVDIEFDSSRDIALIGSWNPNKQLYMLPN